MATHDIHSRHVFESAGLRIRAVSCRAPAHDCGGTEYSSSHQVVLPQSGVFVKHDAPHTAVVADANHALFFSANRPYRVSHPNNAGDHCLVLEYAPATLVEVLDAVDPGAADTPGTPFRAGGARLDLHTVMRRRLFWHRLSKRLADRLEIEETAFGLFGSAVSRCRPETPGRRRTLREGSRRRELVRAVQVAIAARPEAPWSLAALARVSDCSPYHLSHLFGEEVGIPIHQYQLRARLVRALDRLLDSAHTLSAIALDAGFSHHSHFTAAFRRAFGVTPSRLRRAATRGSVMELRRLLATSA